MINQLLTYLQYVISIILIVIIAILLFTNRPRNTLAKRERYGLVLGLVVTLVATSTNALGHLSNITFAVMTAVGLVVLIISAKLGKHQV